MTRRTFSQNQSGIIISKNEHFHILIYQYMCNIYWFKRGWIYIGYVQSSIGMAQCRNICCLSFSPQTRGMKTKVACSILVNKQTQECVSTLAMYKEALHLHLAPFLDLGVTWTCFIRYDEMAESVLLYVIFLHMFIRTTAGESHVYTKSYRNQSQIEIKLQIYLNQV